MIKQVSMNNEKVYEIVDFILNKATDPEVEVIISAIKRRLDDSAHGLDKMNPEKMASQLGRQINDQVGASVDQIRGMVRHFVAEKIKQEAPEISDKDLDQLVDAWVPEPGQAASGQKESRLPKEALLTMIKQFISYSAGEMSASEHKTLEEQIPEWPEKYWSRFPQSIKQSIALFLKGRIDEKEFWNQVQQEVR